MPPIPGAEGAFYAVPGSDEHAKLDQRWSDGEFQAKVIGRLLFGNSPEPTTLFVPDGQDPRFVGGLLAMRHDPPAAAYSGDEVNWRE